MGRFWIWLRAEGWREYLWLHCKFLLISLQLHDKICTPKLTTPKQQCHIRTSLSSRTLSYYERKYKMRGTGYLYTKSSVLIECNFGSHFLTTLCVLVKSSVCAMLLLLHRSTELQQLIWHWLTRRLQNIDQTTTH